MKPGDDSSTKKLADFYAAQGGYQTLAAVYRDELVLWTQVTAETASRLSREIDGHRHLVLVEPPAMSSDGSTWCWRLRRSKVYHGGGIDWLALAMGAIHACVTEAAPHLLERNGGLMHRDNRLFDSNTVEAFVARLPAPF
jgi:hypothetical protein